MPRKNDRAVPVGRLRKEWQGKPCVREIAKVDEKQPLRLLKKSDLFVKKSSSYD
jgi:hypothetical protein